MSMLAYMEKDTKEEVDNPWSEMSYNHPVYDEWDETEENDEEDSVATGMELYFIASCFLDGAEIIISEEENILSNGFHLVSDEEINDSYYSYFNY